MFTAPTALRAIRKVVRDKRVHVCRSLRELVVLYINIKPIIIMMMVLQGPGVSITMRKP